MGIAILITFIQKLLGRKAHPGKDNGELDSATTQNPAQHPLIICPKDYKELCEILNSKTADERVLIDFFATWCGPCKQISPVFAELSKTYDGKISFIKVDVDRIEEAMVAMRVEAMPTFVAMKGHTEISRAVGANRTQLELLASKLSHA